MSESAVPETPREALDQLDRRVGTLVEELNSARKELEKERERTTTLKGMVDRIAKEEGDPNDFVDRLGVLERRNADLEERLAAGREAAERLLARVRFLENQG